MFRAYVQLLSPDRCVTHGRDVGHQRNGRREFALIFLFVFHSELFLGALWTGKVGLVLFRSGAFWCPFDGGGQGERCGAIPEWIRVHPAEMQAAKVAWFSCDAITLNRWNESVFLSIEFIVDRSIEEEEESILVKFRNASDFIRPSYWLSKSRHFVCWTETIHPPCGVIPEHNGRNAMSGTLTRRSGMDWTHSGRNNPFLSRGSVAPKAIPEFMEFAAIPERNEIQRRMFGQIRRISLSIDSPKTLIETSTTFWFYSGADGNCFDVFASRFKVKMRVQRFRNRRWFKDTPFAGGFERSSPIQEDGLLAFQKYADAPHTRIVSIPVRTGRP